MPLTQEQMLEQMRESRANHEEMKALRALILNYTEHAQKAYPTNIDLQECMSALAVTVRLRPVPDDRATYMNERYYSRFAKRNAKAKQRQTLIRAGVIVPRTKGSYKNNIGGTRDPDVSFREKPGRATYKREAPIFPRSDPDDKELTFDTIADMQALVNPPDGNNSTNNNLSGLDFPLEPDDNGNDSKE